jgi:uncharacterized protein DUF429
LKFKFIYGVDFSGAKLAGRNIWVARIEATVGRSKPAPYTLTSLWQLENLCGVGERAVALAHLVRLISESQQALWALDFPFGLPVEVLEPEAKWPAQFNLLHAFGEDAYGVGLECLRRARTLGGPNHIRRLTDIEEKAPFDSYHYRIIYQTFYGMRDVLGPLRRCKQTAILPFQYRRLSSARRVIIEACPASTLKRLGLPHQNYKQPQGGRMERKRLRTRRTILDGLAKHVGIAEAHRRVMMRNGAGDALDAVVAAVGAVISWRTSDHRRIARDYRYAREGRLYV